MEENLITVDLNKNLIIPIKEPFNKRELAHFVADANDYTDTIESVENKEFLGSLVAFKDFLEDKNNIRIVQIKTGEDKVLYQETITKPNPESKTEFGIKKYLSPSTDVLIGLLEKKQLEMKQTEFDAYKQAVKEQLEGIRDITLNNN